MLVRLATILVFFVALRGSRRAGEDGGSGWRGGIQFCEAMSRSQLLHELYCGDDDCYELLGVPRNASRQTIKKAYHKLSVNLHPDRNPDPAAAERFRKIAKANEVLASEQERSAYDYYLAHPDSLWSLYMGIRAVYPSQTNPLFVVAFILAFLSMVQVVNGKWTKQHLESIARNTPNVKRAVDLIVQEKHGAKFRKLSPSEQESIKEEAFQQILPEIVINDQTVMESTHLPFRSLIFVKVLLLPYELSKAAWFRIRWWWLYKVRKQPYDDEAKEYLTRVAVGYPERKWKALKGDEKADLLKKELWFEPKRLKYQEEQEEQERLTRINSTRYRQMKRWKKKNGVVDE